MRTKILLALVIPSWMILYFLFVRFSPPVGLHLVEVYPGESYHLQCTTQLTITQPNSYMADLECATRTPTLEVEP